MKCFYVLALALTLVHSHTSSKESVSKTHCKTDIGCHYPNGKCAIVRRLFHLHLFPLLHVDAPGRLNVAAASPQGGVVRCARVCTPPQSPSNVSYRPRLFPSCPRVVSPTTLPSALCNDARDRGMLHPLWPPAATRPHPPLPHTSVPPGRVGA